MVDSSHPVEGGHRDPPPGKPDADQAPVSRRNAAAAWLWQGLGLLLLVIGIVGAWGAGSLGRILPGGWWEAGWWGAGIAGAIVGTTFGILGLLGIECFNRGRKLTLRTATERISQDTRPRVLYLRSFRDDLKTAKMKPTGLPLLSVTTEEEQLGMALRALGPFVAVGRPGEKLPELGAARLYVSDQEWRDKITEMISRANLVVLRAGETDGFWWEVQRATQTLRPERLLFVIPYGEKEYTRFREKAERYLPCPLPEYVRPTGFGHMFTRGSRGSLTGIVYFGPDWTAHFAPLVVPGFRGSVTKPLVPTLHLALRPVFQQLRVEWNAPPVRWGLISSVTGGLAVLAFIIAVGIHEENRQPSSPFDRGAAQFAQTLEAVPEAKAAFRGLSTVQAQALGRELAAKGFSRLSDSSLLVRASLVRKILAGASPALAAALARGNATEATEAQLIETLKKLDAADIDAWFTITAEAVVAELRKSPGPKQPSESEIADALHELLRLLPRGQAEQVQAILADLSKASDGDAAWAVRILYDELGLLDEGHRRTLARALAM